MKRIWFAFDKKTGSYVYAPSGMQLAETLGLSKDAVYSAIKKAKAKGYNCRYGWFERERKRNDQEIHQEAYPC